MTKQKALLRDQSLQKCFLNFSIIVLSDKKKVSTVFLIIPLTALCPHIQNLSLNVAAKTLPANNWLQSVHVISTYGQNSERQFIRDVTTRKFAYDAQKVISHCRASTVTFPGHTRCELAAWHGAVPHQHDLLLRRCTYFVTPTLSLSRTVLSTRNALSFTSFN